MNNMFSESPHGKVGVVAHACNPSTLQMEKGRPPPHFRESEASLCRQQEKSTSDGVSHGVEMHVGLSKIKLDVLQQIQEMEYVTF